jgi:hypothetical protein
MFCILQNKRFYRIRINYNDANFYQIAQPVPIKTGLVELSKKKD